MTVLVIMQICGTDLPNGESYQSIYKDTPTVVTAYIDLQFRHIRNATRISPFQESVMLLPKLGRPLF